jgi:hypothetical protein
LRWKDPSVRKVKTSFSSRGRAPPAGRVTHEFVSNLIGVGPIEIINLAHRVESS